MQRWTLHDPSQSLTHYRHDTTPFFSRHLNAAMCQWGDYEDEHIAVGGLWKHNENVPDHVLKWWCELWTWLLMRAVGRVGPTHHRFCGTAWQSACTLPNSWRADDGSGYLLQNILGLCVIYAHFWSHHQHPVFGDVIARRAQAIPVEGRVWNEAVSGLLSASGGGVQKQDPSKERRILCLKTAMILSASSTHLSSRILRTLKARFFKINQSFSAIHSPQVWCSVLYKFGDTDSCIHQQNIMQRMVKSSQRKMV